jgi:hypothetical protein
MGLDTIPSNVKELMGKYSNRSNRRPCLNWCSSCGQGQLQGLNKGLCKISNDKDPPVYKCNCGFILKNDIARYFIVDSPAFKIQGKNENGTLNKTDLDRCKLAYKTDVMETFNNACNGTKYTVAQIKIMDQKDSNKPGTQILTNIRTVAIDYGMFNDSLAVFRADEDFKKTIDLLQWLPLKESDFYQSTASQVLSSVTSAATSISNAFR